MSRPTDDPLFDPSRVSICARGADQTIHTLRPEAPAVEPWTSCAADLDEGARFVLRIEPMIFAGLDGDRLVSPKLCEKCFPSTDARRAATLGERLKLFAGMAGEAEYEVLRHHLDAGTLPDTRDGRLGAVAVTLEALARLRAYVESGAYSRADYDAVVEELRDGSSQKREKSRQDSQS